MNTDLAKKLVNLWAEDGANVIDDDSTATFTLENTGSGAGMIGKSSSGAGVAGTSATGAGVIAEKTGIAGPTIAPLRAIMSIASGAFLEIRGAFVSTASMDLAANNTAFMIPVYHGSENILGYVAVSKGLN